MSQTDSLRPKQRRAIAGLMICQTIGQAAEHAGIGEATLHRWLKDDKFVAALRREQDRAIDAAVARLSGEARNAANVLAEIANDPGVSPAIRVQAAGRLLTVLLDIRSHRDLVDRVEELERKAREADAVKQSNRQARTGVRGEVIDMPAMPAG